MKRHTRFGSWNEHPQRSPAGRGGFAGTAARRPADGDPDRIALLCAPCVHLARAVDGFHCRAYLRVSQGRRGRPHRGRPSLPQTSSTKVLCPAVSHGYGRKPADRSCTCVAAYFVPIHLGPEATPSDTSYIPRPEWYYLPMFQWLKMVGGRWSLLGGIVLPGLLAMLFAAIPFLDRGRERRPWRRPIVVAGFTVFVACYAGLGAISYHDDASDVNVSAQLARQKQAEINYMRRPFQPDAASSPAPAAVDPLAAKGAVIFAAGPCGDCHGESGAGTAAAPALIGIGQKYSSDRLAFLLHHRTANMIAGGMPPVDLNQADTDALVAYLRSLK